MSATLRADCSCTPDRPCRGSLCDDCWRRHGCPVDDVVSQAEGTLRCDNTLCRVDTFQHGRGGYCPACNGSGGAS